LITPDYKEKNGIFVSTVKSNSTKRESNTLMTLICPMFSLTKNALCVKSAAVVAVMMKTTIGYARVALPKRKTN
jgi:hypothetical protein